MTNIDFIDAHHHLWDLSKVNYPWLKAKGSKRFFGQPDPIRKNYLPTDYFEDHQGVIKNSIHIQVGCTPEHNIKETQLISSYVGQGAPIAAIIPAVDMRRADLIAQIDSQQAFPLVKGVRHMIGKSPDENHQLPEFKTSEWLDSWRLLTQRNLTFDLQLTEEQYPLVFDTLTNVPELKVVLCHFASPWDQTAQGFNNWKAWMTRFSSLPNCHIKLSGFSMFTHSFVQHNFIKYATAAIEIFGDNRCMLGSNFPVDKLHMSFKELLIAWHKLINSCTKNESHNLSSNTVKRFYNL